MRSEKERERGTERMRVLPWEGRVAIVFLLFAFAFHPDAKAEVV